MAGHKFYILLLNLFFILNLQSPALANDEADQKAQPYILISDVDDTLKITDVLKKSKALGNLFFGKEVFLGMSELYQELQLPVADVFYMSGSPESWIHRIKHLFERNEFPPGQFFLRNWFHIAELKSVYRFKSEKMIEIASLKYDGDSNLPILMIGDEI